jgi:hypothetical protein
MKSSKKLAPEIMDRVKLKIDKDIPFEKPVSAFVATSELMEIGDSVRVETQSQAASLQTSLKRVGKKGVQRKLYEGGEIYYRVWRTE